MRRRDIEERHARKQRDFAMRYANPGVAGQSYAGLEDIANSMSKTQLESWVLAAQAKSMKLQTDMWKTLIPDNRVEVVMLKSAVMMMDVMGDGVPTEWGEPTRRTKYLYYWSNIMVCQDADAVLDDAMWSKLPAGSFFVSWTNPRGTVRHHIGDADKFGMAVSAPRLSDSFEMPMYTPSLDEEEWLGDWECEEGDTSK